MPDPSGADTSAFLRVGNSGKADATVSAMAADGVRRMSALSLLGSIAAASVASLLSGDAARSEACGLAAAAVLLDCADTISLS